MFYPVEVLKALRARAPVPREVQLNGALELYDELPEGERVVIGAGTAEGVGGDRSTFSAHGAFSHEDVAGARKILWEELSVHGAVGPVQPPG